MVQYFPDADRVELRRDGSARYAKGGGYSTDWSLRSGVRFVLASALGVFVVVGLLTLWSTSGIAPTEVGLAFILFVLFSLSLAPRHIPGFDSATTFGKVRSTDEEVVSEPTVPCTVCSGLVGTGVKRTFRERRYVAGVPIRTLNEGENHYCRSCTRADFATMPEKTVEKEFA